jgi:hypothetical protein
MKISRQGTLNLTPARAQNKRFWKSIFTQEVDLRKTFENLAEKFMEKRTSRGFEKTSPLKDPEATKRRAEAWRKIGLERDVSANSVSGLLTGFTDTALPAASSNLHFYPS